MGRKKAFLYHNDYILNKIVSSERILHIPRDPIRWLSSENFITTQNNAASSRRPLFHANTDHLDSKNFFFTFFVLFRHLTLFKKYEPDNTIRYISINCTRWQIFIFILWSDDPTNVFKYPWSIKSTLPIFWFLHLFSYIYQLNYLYISIRRHIIKVFIMSISLVLSTAYLIRLMEKALPLNSLMNFLHHFRKPHLISTLSIIRFYYCFNYIT
jgi:hypothetical protein